MPITTRTYANGTYVSIYGRTEGFTIKLPDGMTVQAINSYVGELEAFYG